MEVEIGRREEPKPAPKPAPPSAPPEPPPTAEELAEQQDKLMVNMGWKKAPEKAAEPTPPPAAPEPPAPEPPPEPELEPEPTTAELIARTAQETGRTVAAAIRETPAPPAPEPEAEPPLEMSEPDAADHESIAFLDANDPKYRGKAKAYRDYLRKLYEYQANWEKENEGEDFNPDDATHSDFYAENDPGITISDIERGRARMEARVEVEREFGPKIRAFEQDKLLQEEMPKIKAKVSKRIGSLVAAVDPELAKKVTDSTGKIISDGAKLKALEETEDPVTVRVLMDTTMDEVVPLLMELEMMGTKGLNYHINMRDPKHQVIDIFRQEKEWEMSQAPKEQQVVNGKQWISIAEMMRLPAKDRDRYWVLTVDDLTDLLIDRAAKKAKAQIAQHNELEAKRQARSGQPRPPAAQPPARPPAGAVAPQPQSTTPRPLSPSLSSPSDVVTTPKKGDEAIKSEQDRFIQNAFS